MTDTIPPDERCRLWLQQVYQDRSLEKTQCQQFVELILKQKVSPALTAALLALISKRGETSAEISGALQAVHKSMKTIALQDTLAEGQAYYDVVGTGGDGKKSVNLSTATAICLAALGLPCAKHGNVAQSGFVGSADILRLCGIPIDLEGPDAVNFFSKHNFLFLFAPSYHPEFKHVGPLRQTLKIPTLFNLLGPLSNPSKPARIAVGARTPERANLISQVESEQLIYSYSSFDGFDEVSTEAETAIFCQGKTLMTINPRDFFSPFPVPTVSSSEHALATFLRMLGGQDERLSKALAINLTLCIALFQDSRDLKEIYQQCHDFIRQGKPLKKLESMRS